MRVDGDLALLHRLEQRRLGLRRGPVDLVGEHDVGEDAAGAELELVGGAVPHRHAGDVGRQEVGGELDAVARAADRRRDRLGQRGLADAGDVLDEEVALGEEAHEREVHLLALALDDALDVAEQGREQAAERRVAARRGGGLNHEHLQRGRPDGTRERLGRSAPGPDGPATVRTHDERAGPDALPGAVVLGACRRARAACARRCGRPRWRRRPRLARPRWWRRAAVPARCPTPTTCGSASRPSTARRGRPDPARPRRATSSGAGDEAGAAGAPDGARNRPIGGGSRPGRLPPDRDDPWRSRRLGRALLLNASFEPLCVVPMRRAVVLVLKEKAEIVARNGAVLHSERAELPGAGGDPPPPLRPGAVPQPGAAVAPGRVRPRRPPLPVLQPGGREHRPRGAPLPRWPARLGQRGGLVPGLQLPQGGPPPLRGRPPPAHPPREPRPTSGSWRAPARSTPPGSPSSPRSPAPFAAAWLFALRTSVGTESQPNAPSGAHFRVTGRKRERCGLKSGARGV